MFGAETSTLQLGADRRRTHRSGAPPFGRTPQIWRSHAVNTKDRTSAGRVDWKRTVGRTRGRLSENYNTYRYDEYMILWRESGSIGRRVLERDRSAGSASLGGWPARRRRRPTAPTLDRVPRERATYWSARGRVRWRRPRVGRGRRESAGPRPDRSRSRRNREPNVAPWRSN